MRNGCPFCDYDGPSPILADYPSRHPIRFLGDDHINVHVVIIEPLNPVVPGHVLAIPTLHAPNALDAPDLFGETAHWAARYAREWRRWRYGPNNEDVIERANDFNLITSVGKAATQTVQHLHVHVVPRRPDDGLALPWSDGGRLT